MLSFIIPFKNGNRYRYENIVRCIANLRTILPDSEIIVVETDTVSHLTDIDLHLKYMSSDGLFSRGFCANIGVQKSKNDIICLMDVDLLFEKAPIMDAFKTVSEEDCMVIPFKYFINLPEGVIDNDTEKQKAYLWIPGRYVMVGGCFFMRKSTYWKVGGFHPDFRGWGCEDDAFALQVKFSKIAVKKTSNNVCHQFHPPAAKGVTLAKNRQLMKRIFRNTVAIIESELHGKTDNEETLLSISGMTEVK